MCRFRGLSRYSVLLAAVTVAAFAVLAVTGGQAAAAGSSPVALILSERTAAATVNYPTYEKEFNTASAWLDNFFSYDIISDREVEAGKLTGYKLAILPENAVMSAQEVQAYRDFVAQGGKVIIVFSTSLRNDQLKLSGLQLGDLVGVAWVQWASDPNFKQIKIVDAGDILADAPASIPVPTGSSQQVQLVGSGKVLAVRAGADGSPSVENPAVIVASDAGVYFAVPVFLPDLLAAPELQQAVYATIKYYAPEAVKAPFAAVEIPVQ